MHLKDVTAQDQKRIAEIVGTTYGTIRGVANGTNNASSMRAILIEEAGKQLGLNLPRELHATACAICEFPRECRPFVQAETSTMPVEVRITKARLDRFGNNALASIHVIKELAAAGIPVDSDSLFMRGVKSGVMEVEFVPDLAGVEPDEYVYRWRPE